MQVLLHCGARARQLSVWASHLLGALVLAVGALAGLPARAQGELSALSAISALPVASVVGSASGAAGSAVAAPVLLSAGGAVLAVKSVAVSARGTVYVLERASDGAVASVEVAGRGASGAAIAAGTLVGVSVIGAGVILSAAGEVVAFLPNAMGRALLHNERLTP